MNMNQKYEVYWLEKGTVLAGKYEIQDVISEGGFGIVYLGYDTVLNMTVAVKEYFPRRLATRNRGESALYIYKPASNEKRFEEGMNKFLNEARFLAQFHKLENVVTVRDFFYANQTAYIVNEHIVGESIKEYVQAYGKIKPDKVLKMMHPILRSLSEFHKAGLLHRDIAPDNIIIQGDKAVLIDFGAARLNDLEDERSKTVFFKCGYSAVEQYTRKGKQGPLTDIYAICATMYYMLTGVQPVESVQRYIKDTVVPLTKYKSIRMSKLKKRAIMKGMSVSRKKRFATVGELCRSLYGEKVSRWKRYRLAGAFFVLMVGGGIGSFVRYGGSGGAELSIRYAGIKIMTPECKEVEKASAVYKMPSVVGMKKERAGAKLHAVFGGDIVIRFRYVYSSDIRKSRVVSQSIPPRDVLNKEELKHTVFELRISKGQKNDVPKETPPTVNPPEATRTPETASRKNYAGLLPW